MLFTSDLQKMTPFLSWGILEGSITETHLKFWGLPGELRLGPPDTLNIVFKTQKTFRQLREHHSTAWSKLFFVFSHLHQSPRKKVCPASSLL